VRLSALRSLPSGQREKPLSDSPTSLAGHLAGRPGLKRVVQDLMGAQATFPRACMAAKVSQETMERGAGTGDR
jgi:hypothetical protein